MAIYLIIDPLYEAQFAKAVTEYPDAPPSNPFGKLSPSIAVFFGVLLSIVFAIHWWWSGLFGKAGASRKPIANGMLVITGLAALLEIFEHGALDYFDYSLFCHANEPTAVIVVDEVYRCERSLMIRKNAQLAMLLLPILAIPVRIIESRLGEKYA